MLWTCQGRQEGEKLTEVLNLKTFEWKCGFLMIKDKFLQKLTYSNLSLPKWLPLLSVRGPRLGAHTHISVGKSALAVQSARPLKLFTSKAKNICKNFLEIFQKAQVCFFERFDF